jgi:hypothetical protein
MNPAARTMAALSFILNRATPDNSPPFGKTIFTGEGARDTYERLATSFRLRNINTKARGKSTAMRMKATPYTKYAGVKAKNGMTDSLWGAVEVKWPRKSNPRMTISAEISQMLTFVKKSCVALLLAIRIISAAPEVSAEVRKQRGRSGEFQKGRATNTLNSTPV